MGQGVSASGPGVCVPHIPLRQTPPWVDTSLGIHPPPPGTQPPAPCMLAYGQQQAVRIPLECILVVGKGPFTFTVSITVTVKFTLMDRRGSQTYLVHQTVHSHLHNDKL